MATSRTDYDAIVIGGGPAGLQATLTLGRVHRRVLMLDSGSYRNDPAHHMHNVVTHDGTPPAEFRAAAREDLSAYDNVTVREAAVTSVQPAGDDFAVAIGDEVVTARGIVLATGVRDTLPDKPGLAELFGGVVAHCPFCHGHEFAGQHVGILGTKAAGHLPGILAPITSRLTVLTDGDQLDAPLPDGVQVRTEPVTGVCPSATGARVSFADGPDEELGGLYVATTFAQSAPFAQQLGLRMLPSGCVEIDVMGRTSLPGVHAAGDMAHHPDLPMPMAAVLTAAAAGQVAAASLVGLRLVSH
jgi:thioredoxin reductase